MSDFDNRIRQPQIASLEVFLDNELIFLSNGKWLHPLFELEAFLKENPIEHGSLAIKDKIIGAAAAFLVARLEVRRLHAGILSRPGQSVLKRFGIEYSYERIVDKIECCTETLISTDMDSNAAYAVLVERARLAKTDKYAR